MDRSCSIWRRITHGTSQRSICDLSCSTSSSGTWRWQSPYLGLENTKHCRETADRAETLAGLPVTATYTGHKNGATGTSRNSSRTNAKSRPWECRLGTSSARKDEESLLNTSQQVCLAANKVNSIMGSMNSSVASRSIKDISSSTGHSLECISNTALSLGLLV